MELPENKKKHIDTSKQPQPKEEMQKIKGNTIKHGRERNVYV